MGEHRFATPFLAICHASCAALAAVCLVRLAAGARRIGRAAAAAGVLAVAVVGSLLVVERIRRGPLYLDDVTIARVAALQGGARWEHQMRLGVPYGVVMLPDAGGSLLVGGMQLVDDAYLADFVLAHMGRYFGSAYLLGQMNQYQHEERRPDLVSPSTAIASIDTSYLGTRYLAGAGHLLARRDLVEVTAIDDGAQPVFDDGRSTSAAMTRRSRAPRIRSCPTDRRCAPRAGSRGCASSGSPASG